MTDRIDHLIARHLEGTLDAAELAALSAALAADPGARDLLIQSALHARLIATRLNNAELGTPNAEPTDPLSPSGGWQRAGVRASRPVPRGSFGNLKFPISNLQFAAAAALLLAAAAVAVYFSAFNPQPETRNPKPASPASPVASVIESTGTLITGDRIANPGDEIPVGDVSLDAGSAEFRLDSGVSVALYGPTRLTVADPMRVALAHGSASFDCPHEATGFSVDVPGGGRVVDLGTRFTVTVGSSGRSLVRVAEGRVELRLAADHAAIPLTNGHAAVFEPDGPVTPMRSATCDFAGLVAAEYPGTPLAGQDGWAAVSGNHPVTLRADSWPGGGNWAFTSTLRGYQWLRRPNDERFALSIPDGSLVVLEFDLRIGNAGRGGRVGFIDADGRPLFTVGNSAGDQRPGAWAFIDRRGEQTLAADHTPTTHDEYAHVVAMIDLAAFDGDGSLSLSVAPIGQTPVPVAGMQGVNMHLGDTDGSDINGLTLGLFNAGGIGRIKIQHHVPMAESLPPTRAANPTKGTEK